MSPTPPTPEGLLAAASAWAADDPDPNTRAEIEALVAANDVAGLSERFATRLQFGTAGLRGQLGAGPNRMNRALVRRAAAGLARYLVERGARTERSVVIGFDARHQSDLFAADTAAVLAGAGIIAHLFPGPVPTPVLAYAIRQLGGDAGVMVTASHNPAQYNGYKVYLGDGAQIVPPTDQEISAQIESVQSLAEVTLAQPDDPRIVVVDDRLVEAYLTEALAQSPAPPATTQQPALRIVYTPMHGVGGGIATELLRRAGFGDITTVRAQFDPDPDFPTVAFPNPEEPGALDLALAEARRVGADLVLANDPDADRLAVAIPAPQAGDPDGWRALSGDEIGVLLADHILTHSQGRERLVVTSIVSSTMLSRMAEAADVHFVETLTGFKWLARSADDHPDWRFAFGYEEALGYCVGSVTGPPNPTARRGPMVRDKDGITAALMFAQLVAGLRDRGRSVDDQLDDLARFFGAHVTKQWSSTIAGPDGPARIRGIVERMLATPPKHLDGFAVNEIVDLQQGGHLPPTEGVVLYLSDNIRIIVRPSGTEPKIKVYFEVVVPVADDAKGVVKARAKGTAVIVRLQRAMSDLTRLPL